MAFTFADVKALVKEKGDGRTFSDAQHARWANGARKSVAQDPMIKGIYGLFFLYKEATVKDGAVENESKYAIPTDYIDHLLVYFDGTLMTGSPPKMLGITQEQDGTGLPQWVRMLGLEFDIRPIPNADAAGSEIKLLYNGLPGEVPASENDNFTDYFLNHYLDLHVYGMAGRALESIGALKEAVNYRNLCDDEKSKLMIANRQYWVKNARIRFLTWDEFQEQKRITFPQYAE